MTLQYEDTVEPEIAPCDDCGILVDEGDVIRIDGDWLCESCAEAQMQSTGQVPDA
jgi:formylmethanofuran dehydrogenase subunit E